MKKIILLWALCAFWGQHELFSQGKVNVDSLTNVLNKYPKEDTVKIKILFNLVSGARKMNDVEQALNFSKQAINISEQLKDDFWIGRAYYMLASIYFSTGDLQDAKIFCEKSKTYLQKGKHGDYLGFATMQSGSIAARLKDFDTALRYYEDAIIIFDNTKNVRMKAQVVGGIATINYLLGKLEEAMKYFKIAITLNEESKDNDALGLIYNNINLLYIALGDYAAGLEYAQKAITLAKSTNNLPNLGRAYANIGVMYNNLNDYKEYQQNSEKALEIFQKLNDKEAIATMMLNLAKVPDNDESIERFEKVIKYSKETENISVLAYAHQGIAGPLIDLKKFQLAYYHVNEGLKLEKDLKDIDNLILLNTIMAKILIQCSESDLLSFKIEPEKRYEKAKEYLEQSFNISNNSYPREIKYTWLRLSEVFEKEGDYTKAYQSYKKYITLNDSISGDDVKKQITRKEIQYEFDKKETELKFQQQLTVGELEKQRLLTFQQEQALTLNRQTLTLKEQALTLSNKDLLLATKEKDLAHLAFLKEQAEKQEKGQLLSLSQEREKGKELDLKLKSAALFSKNLELSAKQKQNLYLTGIAMLLFMGLGTLLYFYTVLRKQKNIIAQQNELNEHTISILSHDIKEPLLGVKLLLKKLNKEDPFVAQASQSLENQINSVNSILNNLLRMKKLALSKKDKNLTANVNEAILNVLQDLHIAIKAKELIIQNELPQNTMLPISPEKLQIILHNLLSNAVKYSFSHQNIRIFQEEKGICIQDFGVGLSPEQRSKIMREVTASKEGTKQERGNGLGLFLVGAMLQGEQIRVVFDTPEVGGTIVKVVNG